MKINMLLYQFLVWVVLMGIAIADLPPCTFEGIMQHCGKIVLHSIDDENIGAKPLKEWETNVINPVSRFATALQTEPNAEGVDNQDVAIAYAFMHYMCFDDYLAFGEENKIYLCMRELCPRAENIEPFCDGLAVSAEDVMTDTDEVEMEMNDIEVEMEMNDIDP
jgi:hypothetical protein